MILVFVLMMMGAFALGTLFGMAVMRLTQNEDLRQWRPDSAVIPL